MSTELSDPQEPLLSSVLAVLKAAKEHGYEITRTKLAKLLYLADLNAVEDGETQFTGATWRWDNYGPFDTALLRAEDILAETELVERRDERALQAYGSCALKLSVDIHDPLPVDSMRVVRDVVATHGRKAANTLVKLSYSTPPMVEANMGEDRGVLLDLSRARRARQARRLRERFSRNRAARPPQTSDPGVEEDLRQDMAAFDDIRRRANAAALGEA